MIFGYVDGLNWMDCMHAWFISCSMIREILLTKKCAAGAVTEVDFNENDSTFYIEEWPWSSLHFQDTLCWSCCLQAASVVGGKSRRSEFLTLHFLFIMHVPSAQPNCADSRHCAASARLAAGRVCLGPSLIHHWKLICKWVQILISGWVKPLREFLFIF